MNGFGILSKLSFGFRTLLGSLLVVAAALLVIVLSNWKYVRVDFSAAGQNTLDQTILDVIDNLPGPVTVDVFVGALPPKFASVQNEVLQRTQTVFSVAEESRRNRIQVEYFDLGDLARAKARQEELGVQGVNIVVFSSADGQRRSVRKLYGDLVLVDWGSLTLSDRRQLRELGIFDPIGQPFRGDRPAQPARLSIFRAEEVFTESLLRVADGDEIKAYFAMGQGEPELQNTTGQGLSRLLGALANEGFGIDTWQPGQQKSVPTDCTVLVLLGARKPYPGGTLDAVEAYAKAGGRVIVAPSLATQAMDPAELDTGQGLLLRLGILPLMGRVCEPLAGQDPSDPRQVTAAVQRFEISGRLAHGNPITQPLRDRERTVLFDECVAFKRNDPMLPVIDLATTSAAAWRDLVGARGVPDQRKDPRAERSEVLSVAMDVELFSATPLGGEPGPKGRVLVMGSSAFFQNVYFDYNQDFIKNAFNSLCERDHRIRVAPLPSGMTRMDLQRSSAGEVLTWTLYLGLPGACALVGIVLAWRRRS